MARPKPLDTERADHDCVVHWLLVQRDRVHERARDCHVHVAQTSCRLCRKHSGCPFDRLPKHLGVYQHFNDPGKQPFTNRREASTLGTSNAPSGRASSRAQELIRPQFRHEP